MDYFIIIFRTILFYIIITIVYRFMGKREVGQLGIVDLIVSILIAELAAISIEDVDVSIWMSIFPMLFLLGIQVLLSYFSLKSVKLREILDGKASVIINRGKINFKEMKRQRYNLDDLLTQLRLKSIRSIEEVDYAILETSGNLSVFKSDVVYDKGYPLPIILDGKLDKDSLIQIRKTEKDIIDILKKDRLCIEDIFYGFYHNKRVFYVKRSDLKM